MARGRPAGVRLGQMRPGARLALIDTLRAAAPWQKVRRANQTSQSGTRRIIVRREDFRFKNFIQPRVLTAVFCVDASGSTAFHRLAEAKGAVELMLAEAYVARTHAALVAFRGCKAELLLPPSRSLTRARALLSTLPGGGGTPLACGINSAVLVALAERAKGRDPLIVLLTDGRANIARDGHAGKQRAWDDAVFAAAQVGRQRISAVFVDTSARARDEGPALAKAMRARYVALPASTHPHCATWSEPPCHETVARLGRGRTRLALSEDEPLRKGKWIGLACANCRRRARFVADPWHWRGNSFLARSVASSGQEIQGRIVRSAGTRLHGSATTRAIYAAPNGIGCCGPFGSLGHYARYRRRSFRRSGCCLSHGA